MANNTQYIFFVSSPGDVENERIIVEDVINRINNSVSDYFDIYLTIERGEKKPSETTDEEYLSRLNAIIKECNFFLLFLYKRYDTVIPGQKSSNTEREINAIIDYLSNDKKKILSYYSKIPNDTGSGLQLQEIMALKQITTGCTKNTKQTTSLVSCCPTTYTK